MRFEEMKLEETREVNGGRSITTIFDPGTLINTIVKQVKVGAAAVGLGASIVSKNR